VLTAASRTARRGVAHLRRAMVRSNSGAARSGYEALYAVASRGVAAAMRARFPGHCEAIFLRRSLTMGFSVPGISDVDTIFLLREGIDPIRHEDMKVFYRRLARLAPILDPNPEIYRWSELLRLHAENPAFRFRLAEGRATWRRLHGADRLEQMPVGSEAQMAVAHAFDLKSRLPYFNAYCLGPPDDDWLRPIRSEYLLFKLALDAGRTEWFLTSAETLFDRAAIAAMMLSAAPSPARPCARDPLLRAFVAHTLRHRLRTSFFDSAGVPAEQVEEAVLRAALAVLSALYSRADVRAAPAVVAEREHFYQQGHFAPSRRGVDFAAASAIDRYPELKARVRTNEALGRETVLHYGGLLVNLSVREPSLGHCTVVLPPAGDGQRAREA
jgi:hypothetical protein